MCDFQDSVKLSHSLYGVESQQGDTLNLETTCKSDLNVRLKLENDFNRTGNDVPKQRLKHEESDKYYQRYEHDEIPVKDETNLNKTSEIITRDSGKASLTNSDLDKLENKIYKNISQELQTDDSSISSLESNIKIFKSTVQAIFDNFYSNKHELELYKARFEEIISRNRNSTVDMEELIKDMLQHIISPDSNLSQESRKWVDNLEVKDNGEQSDNSTIPELLESLHSLVQAYNNDNYLTDSTFDDKLSKLSCPKKEEVLNIYLLSDVPCLQIKMNDRNLLSEINIKDQRKEEHYVASADNLRKVTAKRQEVEKYVEQQGDSETPEREIPVKVSFAKKDIHLNEDFDYQQDKNENRSLLSKICSFICRKFRKA